MTTSTPTLTMTAINHFINGAESAGEGTRTQPVYNPATGAVSAQLRLANRADLDATVAAARAAADSWGDISLALCHAAGDGLQPQFRRERFGAHSDTWCSSRTMRVRGVF